MPTAGASEPPAGTEGVHVPSTVGTSGVLLRHVPRAQGDEVDSLDPKEGICLGTAPESNLIAGKETPDDPRKGLRWFEHCAADLGTGIELQ
jgi:hypothetical protein